MCGRSCRWGGQQPSDVLDNDPFGLERVNRFGHVRPEAGAGAGREACAFADGRYVLAGEAADEDVHGLRVVPVDGGDVAGVQDARPVAREDGGDGLVEFGEPHGFGVEDVFDGEVEPAVAAEQRPNLEARRLVFLVVHEDSG